MIRYNVNQLQSPGRWFLGNSLHTIKNVFNQHTSSVIRQKCKSQNGCFKKTKHVKFSEKTNISNPLISTRTCAYQGVRNVRFLGKFDVLCFFETPVLRFPLLPYYWWLTISFILYTVSFFQKIITFWQFYWNYTVSSLYNYYIQIWTWYVH